MNVALAVFLFGVVAGALVTETLHAVWRAYGERHQLKHDAQSSLRCVP